MKTLDFHNEIFCNLVQEDGLVIMAKGLGIEQMLAKLVNLYCDPANLVLIIGTTSKEEEYVGSKLVKEGVTNLPKIVTSEYNSKTRYSMYMEGGVLFVTSRILVVDMLTDKLPIHLVTGIIVYRAHKIIESCQEAFILRLYKEKNKTGFVKALSESPFSFTTGFCQVNRVMKNLFVGSLQLWPRFHSNVQTCLDQSKAEVIELQLKMSPAMQAIQMSVLDLISICVKEIKRLNPSIDTDELSVENAISKALDKVIKFQLDPVWNQLGPKTKQLIYSIKILRSILISLTQYDCVSFYSQINSIRSSEQAFNENSDWIVLDSAESMFVHARGRVFGRTGTSKRQKKVPNYAKVSDVEISPKWKALSEVLNEINEEVNGLETQTHVLVLTEDDRTCDQLRGYLTKGSQTVLKNIILKYFPDVKNVDVEESSDTNVDEASENEESKQDSVDGTSLSEDLHYGVIHKPFTSFQPLRFLTNPFSTQKFLNDFHPSYVVLYDVDMSVVRQLELYKAQNPETPLRVYFLVYEESAEEQRYLTTLRKEKQAFELLIREKVTMVIPTDIEGRSETHPDLVRNVIPANETVSTRKGGFKTDNLDQKVIVDMREFRSELPSLIHRRGIDVEPVTLEIGDYILTPDICVERKSISDLISSLNSGRLYSQAQSMSRHYKRPMLLIEFDQSKAFSLKGKFCLSNEGTTNDVMSRLILLTLHFPKLRIMWCPNPYATAELFEELKAERPQPNAAQALAISSESSLELPKNAYNHSSESFLSKLPGVNHKNLKLLLRRGTTLTDLAKMSKDEINTILENKYQAEALYDAFHQNMSSIATKEVLAPKKRFTYGKRKNNN